MEHAGISSSHELARGGTMSWHRLRRKSQQAKASLLRLSLQFHKLARHGMKATSLTPGIFMLELSRRQLFKPTGRSWYEDPFLKQLTVSLRLLQLRPRLCYKLSVLIRTRRQVS